MDEPNGGRRQTRRSAIGVERLDHVGLEHAELMVAESGQHMRAHDDVVASDCCGLDCRPDGIEPPSDERCQCLPLSFSWPDQTGLGTTFQVGQLLLYLLPA